MDAPICVEVGSENASPYGQLKPMVMYRALVTMISIYGRVKLESRIILHEQKK
jgi:hypothetical protein